MKALAIDLGGTHAAFALVEGATLVHTETLATDRAKGLKPLLPKFAEILGVVLAKTGTTAKECAGIAMGFAGLVDTRSGRVLSTNAKYDDALSVDLPTWSREAFGLAFRIENDARMALLGENYAGAARGFSDAVMITLGTGVGGAALIEGKLLRGKHMQAGCLGGHIPVLFSGRRCTCGNIFGLRLSLLTTTHKRGGRHEGRGFDWHRGTEAAVRRFSFHGTRRRSRRRVRGGRGCVSGTSVPTGKHLDRISDPSAVSIC